MYILIKLKETEMYISIASKCAKTIKSVLKTKYPKLYISVISDTYSNGDSVHIYIRGFFTKEEKNEINILVNSYQLGHFNNIMDIYEEDNVNPNIPQVKYIFTKFELEKVIYFN